MPTYQYKCEECLVEIEEIQKITDDALVTCPECGQVSLVRVIGPSRFSLVGKDWPGRDLK
jgi:putative FmdB family regulatory protein